VSEPPENVERAPAFARGGDERDRADMLRLVAGHAAGLNELMERHAPRLFNYLLRSLQNEDDAADLAQETFVRVYQNRAKFDADLKFSTWLYAIASNLVRTQYRYRTRHPQPVPLDAPAGDTTTDFRDSLPYDQPNPSESLQSTETAEAVRQAIASLPEELRTPLILCEYEELSHAEIGAILQCTAKAVETRLYRARKQLKSILSRFLNEGGNFGG
jgi:RNA polymerase sigma factor (sigma-70 family)